MNGVHENLSKNTSLAPYDLDGPLIDSLNRPSHIEIKSAASVQTWDIRHPDRLTFSIAPARVPDKNGDYNDCDPKQRNSDMYVFSVYTATDRSTNILDLAWWEFYVCPTRLLDKNYHEQKTISLKKLREFCTPCSFSELFNKISEVCSSISAIEKTK